MSTAIPEKVDLSKYIEMRDDRPNIRGRRLPIMFIVITQQSDNTSIADLAYRYTLTEEQVLAALLYYREHKEEMDRQDALDVQMSEEMHKRYGGKNPGQG
jgi:uncharacterized protein (DUF433 family)